LGQRVACPAEGALIELGGQRPRLAEGGAGGLQIGHRCAQARPLGQPACGFGGGSRRLEAPRGLTRVQARQRDLPGKREATGLAERRLALDGRQLFFGSPLLPSSSAVA
jgi:hypothetical protein